MKLIYVSILMALTSWCQGQTYPDTFELVTISQTVDFGTLATSFGTDRYIIAKMNPEYSKFADNIEHGKSATFGLKLPIGAKKRFEIMPDYYYRVSKNIIESEKKLLATNFRPTKMADSLFVILRSDYTTHLYSKPIYSDSLWVDQIFPGGALYAYSYHQSKNIEETPFWSVFYKGNTYYAPAFSGHFKPEENMAYIMSKGMYNDSLRLSYAKLVYNESEKIRLKERADSIKRVKFQIQQGLSIPIYEWGYENEYSYSVDLQVSIRNLSKKTVKYIWISVAARDAVGERLSSMGKTIITAKGIGPIPTGDVGDYTFENIFWSKVIDKLYITSIKVQYMDNTIKTLSKPMDLIE